jgi:hypothetical protein
MGASSSRTLLVLLLGALESILVGAGYKAAAGGAAAAAIGTLDDVAANI